MALVCDGVCSKAWGINNRPRIQLSDKADDYEFLSDGEVGDAPINPGTWEGGHSKPTHKNQRLNKWCARECERSLLVERDDELYGFELEDFSKRIKNIKES